MSRTELARIHSDAFWAYQRGRLDKLPDERTESLEICNYDNPDYITLELMIRWDTDRFNGIDGQDVTVAVMKRYKSGWQYEDAFSGFLLVMESDADPGRKMLDEYLMRAPVRAKSGTCNSEKDSL